jgi:hypothetical protein
MAAQKKSPIAQERDENERRGLWRWLAPRLDAGRLVSLWTRERLLHLHGSAQLEGAEGQEGVRKGTEKP